MKIVIDIPEEDYEHIKEYYEKNDDVEATYSYIYYGTPLPEKHGGLMILSKDKLKENLMDLSFSCQKWISEVGLSYATVAIIEAESEEEE